MIAPDNNGIVGMRHLRWTSRAITVLGAIAILAALALDLGAALILMGVLLTVAGIVKVVVVHLWMHVAGLGTDRHDPIPPN
jgi:hypothetical protein